MGLKLLNHYLTLPNLIRFIDSSFQSELVAEMKAGKIELKTARIPEWFKKYILLNLQKDKDLSELSAKNAENIDAVRLQYEKLKKN